jgi:hypothetical protein
MAPNRKKFEKALPDILHQTGARKRVKTPTGQDRLSPFKLTAKLAQKLGDQADKWIQSAKQKVTRAKKTEGEKQAARRAKRKFLDIVAKEKAEAKELDIPYTEYKRQKGRPQHGKTRYATPPIKKGKKLEDILGSKSEFHTKDWDKPPKPPPAPKVGKPKKRKRGIKLDPPLESVRTARKASPFQLDWLFDRQKEESKAETRHDPELGGGKRGKKVAVTYGSALKGNVHIPLSALALYLHRYRLNKLKKSNPKRYEIENNLNKVGIAGLAAHTLYKSVRKAVGSANEFVKGAGAFMGHTK